MQRRELMLGTLATLPTATPWPATLWAQASDYPKAGATLRCIVRFLPGGLIDVIARMLGQRLGERWKVTVVIDNKPGGGGQIGADAAAKAAPDGSTGLAAHPSIETGRAVAPSETVRVPGA